MIKSVMYHYVRPMDESGLDYLNLSQFRRQLDFFSKNGGIVTRDSWIDFKAGKNIEGHLLTFDDGLADHYKFVLPELIRRKLFAIFFVPTNPLESKSPLTVHLLHAALARVDWFPLLRNLIDITGINVTQFDNSILESTYRLQGSPSMKKDIKRIVNYGRHTNLVRDKINELLLKVLDTSEQEFCNLWYINPSQCVELSDNGMSVESHSVSHRLLKNLSDEEVIYELQHSKEFLAGLGLPVTEFCFPFGGTKSFSQHHKVFVARFYKLAHSVDPKPSHPNFVDLYEVPRYDCLYWLNV